MDPITQGAVGSLVARAVVKNGKKVFPVAVLGGLSALAPDLDVLIQSSKDHLVFLEYHRQFTHSLFFIPFGALICSLFFWFFIHARHICNFKTCLLACLAGYATHGLIDSCTTYGTVLFWPFSDMRVAWSIISIIDPLFTGFIIIGLITSIYKPSITIAYVTVLCAFLYLSLGAYQNYRVTNEMYNIAKSRNHAIDEVFVKPSFANIVVWRTVYLYEDRFYIDAIRAGRVFEQFKGGTVRQFALQKELESRKLSSVHEYDLQRFNWFTNDMLGFSNTDPNRIIDVRYSLLPNGLDSIWYVEIDAELSSKDHLIFKATRNDSWESLKILTSMVF